jgi:serine/threonine protein kinase
MKELLQSIGLDRVDKYIYAYPLSGGMASDLFVYESEKGHRAIVKMLISPRNDAELKMFQHEVDALKNIPEIGANRCVPSLLIDITKYEPHSIYYYAMEYFDGETLKEYLEKSPPPWNWEKALSYLYRIATALSYSSIRYVHRDLHFGNIYLVNSVKFSHEVYVDPGIRILDFGCTKDMLLDAAGAWTENQFRHFGAISTWSPEFIDNPSTVTSAHDSWALGVILFRLLTNDYPVKATSFGQLVDKYRGMDIDWKAIRELKLPYAVEQLLKNLLSFNPDVRFKTGVITAMCTDIFHRDLLDKNNHFIDTYMAGDASIHSCARCGWIVGGRQTNCNQCGNVLDEDTCAPILETRNIARSP